MQKTYQLVEGPDKVLWVSIQPLMEDIKIAIDEVMKLDISRANEAQRSIVDFKLMGLRSIHEFLGALVTEQQLAVARSNLSNAEVTPNLVTKPTTITH
jgi:hypothetical protein